LPYNHDVPNSAATSSMTNGTGEVDAVTIPPNARTAGLR
jgi:hypothetical protein